MSTRPQFGSRIGARMRVNGHMVNYFCGTSYYSMHSNPDVMAAASQAIEAYGLGVATNADLDIYDELKNRAAHFFGVEEITYFASGYLSISVLLKGLRDEFDFVLVELPVGVLSNDRLVAVVADLSEIDRAFECCFKRLLSLLRRFVIDGVLDRRRPQRDRAQ